MLLALLAALAVSAGAAPQAKSGDGSFAVETPPGWKAVTGSEPHALELAGPERQSFFMLRDLEDLSEKIVPPRLKGAGAAQLKRSTKGGLEVRYAMSRRRDKRLRFQGWLRCGDSRFEFDAVVQRSENPFRLLDTMSCEAPKPQAGEPLGETGWQLAVPRRLVPEKLKNGRTHWRLVTKERAGRNASLLDVQTLSYTYGSEQWTPGSPWPACGKQPVLEPPTPLQHRGKPAFRYVCGRPEDSNVNAFVDVVYSYDAPMTTARYVRLTLHRFRHYEGGCPATGCIASFRPPDSGLFKQVLEGLGPGAAAPAAPAQPSLGTGAVPMLR